MSTFLKKIKFYGLSRTIKVVLHTLKVNWQTCQLLRENDGVDKCKIHMMVDMLWCLLLYGADHYNYRTLKYYNLNHYGRNQFISNLRNDKLISAFDTKGTHELFRNKEAFYKKYDEFVNHNWMAITPPVLSKILTQSVL